jgi:UDP:flavonoid glycosyltransferase YjiC (YdhE family)
VRVTVLAVGSRGDVQPLVALALGLQEAGHEVRVAAPCSFGALVRERGLDFADVGFDARALLGSELGTQWLGTGRNVLSSVRTMRRVAEETIERYVPAMLAACEESDAILATQMGVLAYERAVRDAVPFFMCYLFPFHRTREFPSVALPRRLPLGAPYNLLTHVLIEHLLWVSCRRVINGQLVRAVGLPPLRSNPFTNVHRRCVPVLAGYSPIVVPRPADWHGHIHLTGYWHLPAPVGWSPPRDLQDFLDSGPPPVYVGMGSMVGPDPEGLMGRCVAALRAARQRGVIATGWGGLRGPVSGEDTFVLEEVPHEWVFPRVRAVVCHGGAGTVAAALRAGIPLVICPFFSDQFYWGERVSDLGAGPRAVPVRQATLEGLASAIRRAVTRPTHRQRARELGEHLRAEDGVAAAVDVFHSHL